MGVTAHVLHNFCLFFINATSYHFGQYEPLSPCTTKSSMVWRFGGIEISVTLESYKRILFQSNPSLECSLWKKIFSFLGKEFTWDLPTDLLDPFLNFHLNSLYNSGPYNSPNFVNATSFFTLCVFQGTLCSLFGPILYMTFLSLYSYTYLPTHLCFSTWVWVYFRFP